MERDTEEFNTKTNLSNFKRNRIPKKSTHKMLMKIPKETNFSNKRAFNYMTDCNEEQKSEYIFPPTKYSTITPVRNKYIKHLEEYSCETENMNKVINTQREELYESDTEIKTIKIIPGNNQRKEEIKINPCSRIKQIRLNKIPLQQLELNPSVDSTPRDISVTSLASSISSIFLSPVTFERVCQTKLMKIKEKVINSNSEISQDFSTIKDFNDIKMQENSETPK